MDNHLRPYGGICCVCGMHKNGYDPNEQDLTY